MDDNEEATVRTLTASRTAISDLVQQYRKRVLNTPGGNIFAEFTSVVDAVNCAVEIQRELAERNSELADNRKMAFRIQVKLGDVIEEEGWIYGDCVNIAARVEAMANAGGICISGRLTIKWKTCWDQNTKTLFLVVGGFFNDPKTDL